MAIIVPCAGKSSRFPGTRPKYLLTMPDGRMMIEHALQQYELYYEEIYVVILKEHDVLYSASNAVNKAFNHRVKIHILDEETQGPAETVYQVSKNLHEDEPIFIKDCDSFFYAPWRRDNHICVADLRENLDVSKVAAKSFVTMNNQGLIHNIVEKSVVSNYICVGGYGFERAGDFNKAMQHLMVEDEEVFVSHIVRWLLATERFDAQKVENYVDVGTLKEFLDYSQKRQTIFCDLDGTLFYNQSKYFENSWENEPEPILSAVNYMLDRQEEGATIIFVTSRSDAVSDVTEKKLKELGFTPNVIYNLPHSPRVIVNDITTTNPYPSAQALNVPRDDEEFWSKL
jgi:GTP:adenosylcobinamide-phosphate guanylyltransferase